MTQLTVASQTPVSLYGGGPVPDWAFDPEFTTNRALVAADGGANTLMARGVVPDAVYGDMDSITPGVRAALPPGCLREIAEQDSTDFDKALRHITAPLVYGFGFVGGQVDHALAALTVLANHPDRRCILLGAQDCIALLPPRIVLPLPAGLRVSLFPLAPVRARSDGLVWPLDGLDFAPAGRVGTSNRARGPVTITVDAPAMLIILPRDHHAGLAEGLLRSPAPSSVRGG